MHPFRAAIENGDHEAAMALLDTDVRFRSAIVDLRVMVRPLSGLLALADAMSAKFAS